MTARDWWLQSGHSSTSVTVEDMYAVTVPIVASLKLRASHSGGHPVAWDTSWQRLESNQEPPDLQSGALPIELQSHAHPRRGGDAGEPLPLAWLPSCVSVAGIEPACTVSSCDYLRWPKPLCHTLTPLCVTTPSFRRGRTDAPRSQAGRLLSPTVGGVPGLLFTVPRYT